MVYDPEKHNRQSIRLMGYDYSQAGFYYITICTQDMIELFGIVEQDKMILNDTGEIVDTEWNRIPKRYEHVLLDEYQIMPNHMHGIVEIKRRGAVSAPSKMADKPLTMRCMNNQKPDDIDHEMDIETGNLGDAYSKKGAATAPLQSSPTLGQIIGGFKYLASKTINDMDGVPGRKIWQRGFYDHIIRNEEELNRVRKYIMDNPVNWTDDDNNPDNIKKNN